ncbi:MAG: acyl--CoA ligase [Rhodobacteraceae bacterium]|nr:acyl--CoA ligase [Paracoccaceae bacterium]
MTQGENLGFVLQRVASERPDQAAIVFEDMTITYDQLLRIIFGFAAKMQQFGVGQEDFVIVDTDEPTVAIASLFAAALLGAKYANNHEEFAHLKRFTPTKFFHSVEKNGSSANGSIKIDASWTPQNQPDTDIQFTDTQDQDSPWLIVHTSGSTGFPKFIGLTQAQILARSNAASVDFISGKTVFCSMFDCTARPYISRMLATLINGATLVDSKKPEFWIPAGVNLVMGSPVQVRARLEGKSLSPKLPVLHVGGGKLADTMALDLLQNFDLVIDAYGATETNHSYNNLKSLNEDGDIVTKGQPLDSIVEIVNADGEPCQVNEVGAIRIQNPYLASGYLDSPEAQAKCFIDGWFYPGDIASWGPMRALNFVGRTDHVINLGGAKINALAVDHLMISTKGISDAICFKNPKPGALNELLAFAVFDGSAPQLQAESSAKFACNEQFGEIVVPKHIRPINFIPRFEDGAPDREACILMVLERSRDMLAKQRE